MARILEFSIDGLAGRAEPYSAELKPDVNVFFGLNGSGKTTLLKILHSALSTDVEILKGLPFAGARVKVYLNRYEAEFWRVFERSEPNLTMDSSWETLNETAFMSHSARTAHSEKIGRWRSDPPESEEERLTHYKEGFLPISRLYRNIKTSTGTRLLSDRELDSAFERSLSAQWSVYYAEISNQIAKAQERGFAEILNFFLSGDSEREVEQSVPNADAAYELIHGFFERQPQFAHLLHNKKEFTSQYESRPELRDVVKRVESVEKDIDSIVAPRERFRTTLESMFSGGKHLEFSEKEIRIRLSENQEIGLVSLSSGEKQLVVMALSVLTGGNHCLIVDEPELSMHVDWQKKLVSVMRNLNPKIQLIMATHSPEIMADISDENIFRI